MTPFLLEYILFEEIQNKFLLKIDSRVPTYKKRYIHRYTGKSLLVPNFPYYIVIFQLIMIAIYIYFIIKFPFRKYKN